MTKDLTVGSPSKAMINFGIPILLGSLLQQIYNITDTAIVGKYVGNAAMASLGATGAVSFLILGFVNGATFGFCIPIAQNFGAKNYKLLRKFYVNTIYIGLIMSVVLLASTLLLIDPILSTLKTPDDMYIHSKIYLTTIFVGIPFSFLYNLFAGVLRSVGDSKTPLRFLTISAIINLSLDVTFVIFLEMGVLGAGLATLIAQIISMLLCMNLIRKKFDILTTEKDERKFDTKCIKRLIAMGVPMGLQSSITALGGLFLQASLNELGTIYCAATTSATKIFSIYTRPFECMGMVTATYVGQNLGAKKLDRITKGIKQSLIMLCIYALVAGIFLNLAASKISLVFVSAQDVELIALIEKFILANTSSSFFLIVLLILRNAIQGLGHSSLTMFSGLTEMVARIFVAQVLVTAFAYNGAVLANPIAWLMACTFLVPAFIYTFKKTKKEFSDKPKVNA